MNAPSESDPGESGSSPLDYGLALPSGEGFDPTAVWEMPWWVNWARAYRINKDDAGEWMIGHDGGARKQPIAPSKTGHARPVSWRNDPSNDKHPVTDPDTIKRRDGLQLGVDLRKPERVASNIIRSGVILPVDRKVKNLDGITIIDWDDVRDPETAEVHPVALEAIQELGGYVAISQSGEGLHQWVYGEIPHGPRKFIRRLCLKVDAV